MDSDADIIIVGAGAAGLMAGFEASKRGKSVIVLEARSRIGGRVCPILKSGWDEPIQAGAEFIHEEAPITQSLAKQLGLRVARMDTSVWYVGNERSGADTEATAQALMREKLSQLTDDMSLQDFLRVYFSGDEHTQLRQIAITLAENYDAADPERLSVFALRDEWLGEKERLQFRLTGGYGPILTSLASSITKNCGGILLNEAVRTITRKEDGIAVTTANRTFFAKRVIITAPLPTIGDVQFNPPLPEKIEAAKSIGWGCVVKILVRFKTAWWQSIPEKWSEENFLVAETPIPLWWVQEKSQPPLLTGWIAGPKAKVLSTVADEEIVTTALSSLADIFGVSREFIEEQLVDTHVANWSKEQHSKGAYSYHALGSQQALEEMRRPVWDGAVYFAGEALSATGQVGLVEGAFDSGIDVINRMGL